MLDVVPAHVTCRAAMNHYLQDDFLVAPVVHAKLPLADSVPSRNHVPWCLQPCVRRRGVIDAHNVVAPSERSP